MAVLPRKNRSQYTGRMKRLVWTRDRRILLARLVKTREGLDKAIRDLQREIDGNAG
jgi:hypothetical protein